MPATGTPYIWPVSTLEVAPQPPMMAAKDAEVAKNAENAEVAEDAAESKDAEEAGETEEKKEKGF